MTILFDSLFGNLVIPDELKFFGYIILFEFIIFVTVEIINIFKGVR